MNDQPVIDAYHHEDLRRTRSAFQSVIPVSTGLARGIERLVGTVLVSRHCASPKNYFHAGRCRFAQYRQNGAAGAGPARSVGAWRERGMVASM